jgi:SsrA-binding protein
MRVFNKKVRFNYEIIEEFEAGIVLTGDEVKAIRAGKINISRAYAKIIEGEAYLINADIDGDTKTRKLLLHKKEITSLASTIKAKKLTLIPLAVYTKARLIKLKIALGKLKKKHEKKAKLKAADIKREIEQELRGR